MRLHKKLLKGINSIGTAEDASSPKLPDLPNSPNVNAAEAVGSKMATAAKVAGAVRASDVFSKVAGNGFNSNGSSLSGNKGLTYWLDTVFKDISQGRFEMSLAAITAISALVTGGEVYFEHDRASFGKPIMWFPVAISPIVVAAGIGGAVSKRMAKTVLPAVSAISFATGIVGTYLHVRGIADRPGGWGREFAKYNIEMGPPLFATLLFSMVGGMGIVSAILRREE